MRKPRTNAAVTCGDADVVVTFNSRAWALDLTYILMLALSLLIAVT